MIAPGYKEYQILLWTLAYFDRVYISDDIDTTLSYLFNNRRKNRSDV